MIDGSLVIPVSFNMMRKYINGLWTLIFTKHARLCFTWLTCAVGGLVCVLLYVELLGVVMHGW
jgi:hypothetical protein